MVAGRRGSSPAVRTFAHVHITRSGFVCVVRINVPLRAAGSRPIATDWVRGVGSDCAPNSALHRTWPASCQVASAILFALRVQAGELGSVRCLRFRALRGRIGSVPTKVREAIRTIEKDGWYQVKSAGSSHRQFKHPTRSGRVTIAGKMSDDLAPDTLKSILKQAGLK